jgi:hypothetical protein
MSQVSDGEWDKFHREQMRQANSTILAIKGKLKADTVVKHEREILELIALYGEDYRRNFAEVKGANNE